MWKDRDVFKLQDRRVLKVKKSRIMALVLLMKAIYFFK